MWKFWTLTAWVVAVVWLSPPRCTLPQSPVGWGRRCSGPSCWGPQERRSPHPDRFCDFPTPRRMTERRLGASPRRLVPSHWGISYFERFLTSAVVLKAIGKKDEAMQNNEHDIYCYSWWTVRFHGSVMFLVTCYLHARIRQLPVWLDTQSSFWYITVLTRQETIRCTSRWAKMQWLHIYMCE